MSHNAFRHILGTTALVLAGTAATAQAQDTAQDSAEACRELQDLVNGSEAENIQSDRLMSIVEEANADRCRIIVRDIEAAGGLDAAAENGESYEATLVEAEEFEGEVDAVRAVSGSETVTETVEIERQAVVEGEVAVAVPQPDVSVSGGNAEVNVTSQAPSVDVTAQQPQITVRQPQQTITLDMPSPTITIEQAAPEIIITMPDPDVAVGQAEPQVEVVFADPEVRVEQAEPNINLDLKARIVSPEEAGELAQSAEGAEGAEGNGGMRTVQTRTEQEGEAPNVSAQKPEATVRHQQAGEPKVTFQSAEPVVNYESTEPKITFNRGEEPTVTLNQVGEPKVTFRQASAEDAAPQDGAEETDRAALAEDPEAMPAPAEEGTEAETAEAGTLAPTDEPVAEESAEATDPALAEEGAEPAEGEAMTAAEPGTEAEALDPEAEPVESETAETETMEADGMEADAESKVTLTAAELEGKTVIGENGDKVGDIHTILSDSAGNAEKVLLDVGGFLGLGEKTIALPINELRVEREGEGDDYRISTTYTDDEISDMPRYSE